MGPEAPCCYCCPTTGATCASFSVNLGSPVGQPVPLLPAISNYAYGKKRREKKRNVSFTRLVLGRKKGKALPCDGFRRSPEDTLLTTRLTRRSTGKRGDPPLRVKTRTEHHRSRQLSSPRVKHLCRLDTRPRGRGTLTKKKKKKKWLERV